MNDLRSFLLIVGLALYAGSSLRAAEIAQVAACLPAETSLAIFARNCHQTGLGLSGTRLGQVLQGPAFLPLRNALEAEGTPSAFELRPLFGFGWSDLGKTTAAGAFAAFSRADGTAAYAWVFLNQDDQEQAPACLAAAAANLTAAGYKTKRQTYEGGEMTEYRLSDAEDNRVIVIFSGSKASGVTDSLDSAKTLLNLSTAESLAASESFAPVLICPEVDECVADGAAPNAAVFYLRPMPFWQHLLDSQGDEADPEAFASAMRLGGDGIHVVAGRIDFDATSPCDWEIAARLISPSPLPKALRLMELKPAADPMIPAWIPADVISATCWGWDFASAIRGYGNLFDESNWPGPDGEGLFDETLDGLRDDPEGVRVDLRNDVFDRLESTCVSMSVEAENGTHRDWLYAVQTSEAEKIAATLARFYRGDEDVTYMSPGDVHTWTIPPGLSLFVEGESDSLISIRGVAVDATRLIFTTEPKLLQLALQDRSDAALGDDPDWKHLDTWANLHQGERTDLRGFVRLDRALLAPYAETTNPTTEADRWSVRLIRLLLFGRFAPSSRALVEAAPKFDSIRSGLTASGIVISREKNAFTLRVAAVAADDGPP